MSGVVPGSINAYVRLVFRQHAIRRMFERDISVDDVAVALEGGKLVERYADDYPYPSALWLGLAGARPLHVVVAENVAAGETIIITVYEPDPALWEADWMTRKAR